MGHDPNLFEDPDDFKPERWFRDKNKQKEKVIHPFSFLPFGFGTRMCIGERRF